MLAVADLDADPSPPASSHGTSCAALAAAGSGQVLGVAFGCRSLPIRRTGLDDCLKLAEAFAFAADHGADAGNAHPDMRWTPDEAERD